MEANGGTVLWRLTQLESAVKAGASKENVDDLSKDMDDLRDELKSVRRALYAFALGLPATAITLVVGFVLGHH